MRVLVTGGNGYVGREVVVLLADDHDVCVVDNLRYGTIRIPNDLMSKIRFETTDINDGAALIKVFDDFKPEAVIHLAAVHYIPECEGDPSGAVLTNVVGTINVIRASPVGCRLVFASSGAVYKPADIPHDEDVSSLEPNDIYGLSKLHSERYIRHMARQQQLGAVVVRLFNVIGPGETNPHLVPELIAQLRAGRNTVRLGNLWPKRDYIHVRDAAQGFVATAINSNVPLGETVTVNLGTSRPYSVASILRKLRRITGVRFIMEQDKSRMRKVDRPFLAANNQRIRALFGWEPRLTIDEALTELWANPDLAERLTVQYR